MRVEFHLFVYGTLQRNTAAGSVLRDCKFVARGTVGGVLYDIDGQFPALVMYGSSRVEGEVWHCPVEKLATFDAYERVDDGLFRRVGVEVPLLDGSATVSCWAYVAGPRLGRKLVPAQRILAWES